jgi:amino acid transporter
MIQGARPQLVRAIGRWALTAAVINSVIGSGIYGLPGQLAALAGSWSPVAVLLAGGCIFLIVLSFAEVSGRFDQAGGPYLYTHETLGPFAGFHVGWMHVWTRIIAAAAVLNIFVTYLATLIPSAGNGAGRSVTMVVAMLVVTLLNIPGVRQAAWTVNVFTIAKLLPLLAVILLGMFHLDRQVLDSQSVIAVRWADAILLLVFSYGGFESAIVAGSESRDPRRDMPFALMTAMLVITAVYCLLQLAVVGVLPNAARSAAPVTETLEVLAGTAGATLGTLAVLISTYGWLTGFALMTPRILYAMADRGELPGVLAHVSPRTRTPTVAIALTTGLALALALATGFAPLATASAISRLLILAMTCIALVALRRQRGRPERFRVPAGSLIAVLGLSFCLWLLSTRTIEQWWFLLVVVASGLLIQAIVAKGRRVSHA